MAIVKLQRDVKGKFLPTGRPRKWTTRDQAFSDFAKDFDKEISERDSTIKSQAEELSKLKQKLLIHEHLLKQDSVTTNGSLSLGNESDLYHNERKDMVLDILSKALEDSEDFSRRQHVLDSIIVSNRAQVKGPIAIINRAGLIKGLKEIFSNYRGISDRKKFSDLGLSTSDEGKHLKVSLADYSTSMSKTPSDSRGGLNQFTQIMRQWF